MNLQTSLSPYELTANALNEFPFPIHRIGYKQLCIAIPKYAEDDTQCITKTVYPYVAKVLNYFDWRAVEHSIRDAIVYCWEHGDRAVWEKHFPGCKKPPSNKLFIATMAAYIKQKKPSLPGGIADCQNFE